jgi:hypothetical protein
MQVSVQVENMRDVIAGFRGIADDQIPFATALSLTQTAKLAQAEIWKELPLRFTIRRLQWAKQGIRIAAATKRELVAIVEDIHKYMELQEQGGDKAPQYGKFLAIPLNGARRSERALINSGDLPHAVMASGLGFIRGNVMYRAAFVRSRSRRGFRGVKGFQSGKWSRQIQPMYALVPRANVPKRYGFEQIVRAAVGEHWEQEFGKAFSKAVQTRA